MRQTLAEQQPSTVSGSNYTTAVSSVLADGTAANGYLAYKFKDAGDIIHGTFRTTPRSINDVPNRVNFGFQDEDNAWQTDTLSQVDPDAFVASGNNPVDVQIPVAGICNYDQAQRIANIQLAESLRGNARDDADGTEYFEFESSVKAIHLCSNLGAICGIEWQQLSL